MNFKNILEHEVKKELLRQQGFKPYQKTQPAWCRVATEKDKQEHPKLSTKEGMMDYQVGDYICIGVEGEQWAIKKSIFEKTYEEIE